MVMVAVRPCLCWCPEDAAQVAALIAVARQSPFGRGRDTVIDTGVRDSFQFEPDQITLRNPAWAAGLAKLVARVGRTLTGPSHPLGGRVEAVLYKLLLYRKGGHFTAHRDTEKEKRMFGTLVVQLPSTHAGGALVTRFGGETRTFDFGQAAGDAAYTHASTPRTLLTSSTANLWPTFVS